uniref:Endonuclease V n=1 Tax=Oryzias sinensis TaxID=183150 RepID=A0A8C8DDZ2_9TELE
VAIQAANNSVKKNTFWKFEQERLRQLLVEEDTEDWQRSPDFSGLQRVGGVDLSFIKGDGVNACAQLVVLGYPDLNKVRRHATHV